MDGTTIDRVLAAAAAGAWRCVQTHLSCVVVRGDRVFKLKKPVSLGFVDFARAEARRDACVEEMRLNRRLAPEIYLGVAPLVESAGGVDFGPVRERAEAMAGERVIDWATAMRRLPEPGLLDGVLSRSAAEGLDVAGLGPALDRFAIRLARFHDACPTSPEIARWGHPVAVLRRLKNSLAGLHDHGIGVLAATVPPGEPTPWLALARLVGRRVQAAMPLLAERHARGLVREVHGDLHARNLCVVDGEIVAFDCIEFSFELRCRDIAADATRVGFDLAARGFDGLGRRFLAAWSDAAGDPGARAVFPVFAARDGIVHAFVESVTVGEPEVSAADRGVAAAASRNYAIVAAGYALPPSLVVMAGLPGTGKSVAARAAGTPLRATLLASDAVRKQLAGIAPDERGGPELYTPEWNARTYAELERRAGLVLAEGGHVIVDANNGRRSDRDRFRELARRHGAIVLVVEATCPEAEVLRRLAARTGDAREVSDAGPATYLRLRESFEPIDPASEGEPLRLTPACDAAARIAWRLAAIANARPSAPG